MPSDPSTSLLGHCEHRPIEVEMTLAQIAEIMQPSLAAERDAARDEAERLRSALENARTAIAAVNHAGFDSTRRSIAQEAIQAATEALNA